MSKKWDTYKNKPLDKRNQSSISKHYLQVLFDASESWATGEGLDAAEAKKLKKRKCTRHSNDITTPQSFHLRDVILTLALMIVTNNSTIHSNYVLEKDLHKLETFKNYDETQLEKLKTEIKRRWQCVVRAVYRRGHLLLLVGQIQTSSFRAEVFLLPAVRLVAHNTDDLLLHLR